MNWKIGQKLVCIKVDWSCTDVKLGDIYTFDGVEGEFRGSTYIRLKETPDWTGRSDAFREIVDIGDEVEEYIKSKITETEYA